MTHKTPLFRDYRAAAEELLRQSPRDIRQMSDTDIQALVHELQVHQIELQMQNEELHSAQQALEESHTRLTNLYDFAPVGYVTIDANKKIIEANLTAATMLGIERGNLLGMKLTSFIAPDQQDKFYLQCHLMFGANYAGNLAASDHYQAIKHSCELKMHNQHGNPLYCRLECVMHRLDSGMDGNGDNAALLCRIALIDISEAKFAEEAQQESELKLRVIADAVPDLLYLCDAKGQRNYVSQQFYVFTGMPFGTAEGSGWQKSVHPDDVERLLAGQRIAMCRNEPWEGRFRLRSAAGQYHWFMGRSCPFPDKQSSGMKWLGCDTDIDQLIRTEQALKEADRRKDEFLAMLAHELRNPLAPIRNAAQLLHSPKFDEKQLAWVSDMLERNVAHMIRLVDDLLDTSRITRGTINLQKQRLELSTVLERAVETAQPLLSAKNHQLRLQTPEHPIYLEGDFVRLTQVFTNILNNAAKYTAEGGRIELQAGIENAYAVVHIRDNGMGITASLLSHVFDLFQQDDRGLDRAQGGLGIGLTLVKRLVEIHGGEVTVQSAGKNQGAEFVVRLPRIIGDEIHREAPLSSANASAMPCRQRVLLVEDNADTAQSLASLLEMHGHQVSISADGPQGLAVAEQIKPDAILIDIGLPGMNGYELAKQLRAGGIPRNTLIVALSGYEKPVEDEALADETGFDHYLVKPADIDHLLGLLAEHAHAG